MSNWKSPRKQNNLNIIERFYIFCEGEKTEPQYFKSFKDVITHNPIYKNAAFVFEITGCGSETLRVLNDAKTYVKQHNINEGQVWCVYDKDSFPKDNFNEVEKSMLTLNRKKGKVGYRAAWSNECFEYWFILHFDNYISNNNRNEYMKYLDNKFKKIGLKGYRKNMSDIFSILNQHGNPKLAIRYAEKIIEDNANKPSADIAPGTNVHELVKALAQYLLEDLKSKYL